MSAVSYQSILPRPEGAPDAQFIALPEGCVETRRRDAKRSLTVRVSRAQRRWLAEVASISGKGIDEDVVVRALIDLGMVLPVDWALLAGAGSARQAIHASAGRRAEGA